MADQTKQRFDVSLSFEVKETVASDGSVPSPAESGFFESIPLRYHNVPYGVMQIIQGIGLKHVKNMQDELLSLGYAVAAGLAAGQSKDAVRATLAPGQAKKTA